MSKTYTITLTASQAHVVQNALEEYFRLRMGQQSDFCLDMAGLGRDIDKDSPYFDRAFNSYLKRRDHLEEIMRAFFRIAFEPSGYLEQKTDDMMIAECVWEAIRYARGCSRHSQPWQIGKEPVPKIVVEEKSDAD